MSTAQFNRLAGWFLGIHFLVALAGCVQPDEPAMRAKDVEFLKGKYTAQTFNYFYETVFHTDFSKEKGTIILKWHANPTVDILGDASDAEAAYVEKAISVINGLNLPIQLSMADPGVSASIKIFFGDLDEVRAFLKADTTEISNSHAHRNMGMGRSTAYDGVLEQAIVGIYFSEQDHGESGRYNLVLEEIIQTLGLIGDSYNYPSSLFFENHNPEKSLTDLDIAVLSMLYEPAIPANYSREAFEGDFSDVIDAVGTGYKLEELLRKFPQTAIDDIEACFTDEMFLRHPKETAVFLYGDVRTEDSISVERAIGALNRLSPNLTLRLAAPPSQEPDHGLVLELRQQNQQVAPIKGNNEFIAGKTCMFPKLIKNRIRLSFNASERAQTLRERSIVDALYFSLVPIKQEEFRENNLFTVLDNEIEFSQRYADLFKLIYSNEFVDGLTRSEFRKIRDKKRGCHGGSLAKSDMLD